LSVARPCRDCGSQISFAKNERGRWYPIDTSTGQRHVCATGRAEPSTSAAASPPAKGRLALAAVGIVGAIGVLSGLALIDKQTAGDEPSVSVAAKPTTSIARATSAMKQATAPKRHSPTVRTAPAASAIRPTPIPDTEAPADSPSSWDRSCYPAWGFAPGCYSADNSYLVDAFADWISECLPGDTSGCEQDARDYYSSECLSSSYAHDCPAILDALVADGREYAQER
jgi:hypothetical protein